MNKSHTGLYRGESTTYFYGARWDGAGDLPYPHRMINIMANCTEWGQRKSSLHPCTQHLELHI